MSAEPAPGLYLHLPFCPSICPYCDFYVLTGSPEAHRDFVRGLLAEIDLRAESMWPGPAAERPAMAFDTVYLGGGTPSRLALELLAEILDACRRKLGVDGSAVVTLEANPEDVSRESLAGWRGLGVACLSLGAQSFSDVSLRFLGRRHDAAAARRAAELALEAGFATVSLDLIFGLEGQTPRDLEHDLETVVELSPGHVSLYQLTIHPGTPFGFRHARGRLAELPEDRQAELFVIAHRRLAEAGYEAYEVSNFARAPEHRSRHNRKYWRHVPYLGLGPSAHSFSGRRRWWNERKIKPWRAALGSGRPPVAGSELLTPRQLVLERLMLGLRTREGVDLAQMPEDWGARLRAGNRQLIGELCARGLLVDEHDRLRPTTRGLAVADGLPLRFELPDR